MNKEQVRALPRDARIDFLRRNYLTREVLKDWVDSHPTPNEVVLSYGKKYSPKQLLKAVKDGTKTGSDLAKFLYEGSKRNRVSVPAMFDRAIEANKEVTISSK